MTSFKRVNITKSVFSHTSSFFLLVEHSDIQIRCTDFILNVSKCMGQGVVVMKKADGENPEFYFQLNSPLDSPAPSCAEIVIWDGQALRPQLETNTYIRPIDLSSSGYTGRSARVLLLPLLLSGSAQRHTFLPYDPHIQAGHEPSVQQVARKKRRCPIRSQLREASLHASRPSRYSHTLLKQSSLYSIYRPLVTSPALQTRTEPGFGRFT